MMKMALNHAESNMIVSELGIINQALEVTTFSSVQDSFVSNTTAVQTSECLWFCHNWTPIIQLKFYSLVLIILVGLPVNLRFIIQQTVGSWLLQRRSLRRRRRHGSSTIPPSPSARTTLSSVHSTPVSRAISSLSSPAAAGSSCQSGNSGGSNSSNNGQRGGKAKRNRPFMYFATSLAISDTLALLSAIVQATWLTTHFWYGNDLSCHFLAGFLRPFSLAASNVHVAFMALDRLLTVYRRMQYGSATKRALLLISLSWLYSLPVPLSSFRDYRVAPHPDDPEKPGCVSPFGATKQEQHMQMIEVLFKWIWIMIAPLVVTLVSYSIIMFKILHADRLRYNMIMREFIREEEPLVSSTNNTSMSELAELCAVGSDGPITYIFAGNDTPLLQLNHQHNTTASLMTMLPSPSISYYEVQRQQRLLRLSTSSNAAAPPAVTTDDFSTTTVFGNNTATNSSNSDNNATTFHISAGEEDMVETSMLLTTSPTSLTTPQNNHETVTFRFSDTTSSTKRKSGQELLPFFVAGSSDDVRNELLPSNGGGQNPNFRDQRASSEQFMLFVTNSASSERPAGHRALAKTVSANNAVNRNGTDAPPITFSKTKKVVSTRQRRLTTTSKKSKRSKLSSPGPSSAAAHSSALLSMFKYNRHRQRRQNQAAAATIMKNMPSMPQNQWPRVLRTSLLLGAVLILCNLPIAVVELIGMYMAYQEMSDMWWSTPMQVMVVLVEVLACLQSAINPFLYRLSQKR